MDLLEIINLIGEFPDEFLLGIADADGTSGETYDNDPSGARSTAYDLGRSLGEIYLPIDLTPVD